MVTQEKDAPPKKDAVKAEEKAAAKAEAEAKAEEKAAAKAEAKIEAAKAEPRPATRVKLASKVDGKAFLAECLAAARHLGVDAILAICDDFAALEPLATRTVKKKVVVASSSEKVRLQCEQLGLAHVTIPPFSFDRLEKIKIAISASQAAGRLANDQLVLCLVGKLGSGELDTCMLAQVGQHAEEHAALGALMAGGGFSAQVLDAVLQMALSVGFDGIEGDPVGTILMVGDSTAVMEKSKQLTLNPFQGYSEDDRNLLDPKIRDAVRSFCLLDGAIIVREDGVLLAAGRYLRPPENLELDLHMGQGTRHAAALAITKVTNAIAFVVSKTSGAISIYRGGHLVVELKQPRRRT